jgi:kumamolisin
VPVLFGPLSHAGLKRLGIAPRSFPVTLQLGLVANLTGMANAVQAASDPSSSSYGTYLTLAQLRQQFGAPVSRQTAVLGALRAVGARGTVDVTGLRIVSQTTIGRLQRLFSTTWSIYATGQRGTFVALPARRPLLPAGMRGNVNVVAGIRPYLYARTSLAVSHRASTTVPARSAGAPVDGGTPTRTGTPGPSCLATDDPSVLSSPVGLFPDQIDRAYGIDSLHEDGLEGQGIRLAIVGEAPTPLADVELFRKCFGFEGTPLAIHGGNGVQPILESSLDAMVVSMVAPRLAGFDLWVSSLNDTSEDGDVEGFERLLEAPLEAAKTGAPLPDVVSVSYGICEANVAPFTAARALVERTLEAYASLGITVAIASGDSGSSTCSRGIPPDELTAATKRPYVSWPASSPWVLAVGGTNLTLKPDNTIESTGVWNDTRYAVPYKDVAGGGGGQSLFSPRPWWQPAQGFAMPGLRMVPDVAAFADAIPGYAIVCSTGVQGCGASYRPGQTISFVGGTSAATPLVASMIALWKQKAREQGRPNLGFVPPLLYSMAADKPGAFIDVTLGSNALFDVSCCDARRGYDLASGLGSPLANIVALNLPAKAVK